MEYISKQAALDAIAYDARAHDWVFPTTAIEALDKLPVVEVEDE